MTVGDKLHVGLVAPEFPPELGGVQTYSWELAGALAKAGCRVTVLAPALNVGEISPIAPSDVNIHRVLKRQYRHDASLLERYSDVEVWHGLTANCAWLTYAPSTPVFLSLHGNDLLSPNGSFHHPRWRERFRLPYGSRLERWWSLRQAKVHLSKALGEASALFCNSQFTAKLAQQRSSLPSERIFVTGIGLGTEFHNLTANSPPKTDNTSRFVTVARLDEPRKNIDRVLLALATLPAEMNWNYTVIGGGRRLGELRALATSLGLLDCVTFTGPIPRGAMISRLQESDLFVLTPSANADTVEGFGIVYLEANACGLPVLASRTGGVPDAVDEGVSGWLIDDPTSEAIASAMRRFITAPWIFDRDACQRHARRFKWRDVAARCLAAYAQ